MKAWRAVDSPEPMGVMARQRGAFAVEFVLIVVGVLVALAADSALERRRLKQDARRALEALRLDVQADLEQLGFYWEPALTRQESARQRLSSFLQGTAPIADSLQFVRDVSDVATYVTFDPNTSAIQELKSTGALGLIEDDSLRVSLLRYVNAVENIAQFDVLHRALALDLYANLAARVAGGLALPAAYQTYADSVTCAVRSQSGWESCADPELALAARRQAAIALDSRRIRSSDDLRLLLVGTGQPSIIRASRYRALRDDGLALVRALDAMLGQD